MNPLTKPISTAEGELFVHTLALGSESWLGGIGLAFVRTGPPGTDTAAVASFLWGNVQSAIR